MSDGLYANFKEMEEGTVREDGDSAAAFDVFADEFIKCSADQRRDILRRWDTLAEGSPQPSRLNAAYSLRHRELRRRHELLKAIGR
jgi:hypothetical protein